MSSTLLVKKLPSDTDYIIISLTGENRIEFDKKRALVETQLKLSPSWGKSSITHHYSSMTGQVYYVAHYATDIETVSILKLSHPEIKVVRMWPSELEFICFTR